MAVNKVATVVLIDRSRSMDVSTSNGQTYFERCKWILSRIILRKIFAYENDEIGVVTFGPEGIEIISHLSLASWDTFSKVQQLTLFSETKAGNWASGIVKAIDTIETETSGKRFKYKQLVVLSNFSWSSSSVSNQLDTLITVINAKGHKVLVIGVDIERESQLIDKDTSGAGGMAMLLNFVGRLDNGVTLSFEDVEEDMKYYSKKVKSKRLNKIQMKIGSQITIPVRWMKASADDSRLKFEVPHSQFKPKVLNLPLISNERVSPAWVNTQNPSVLGKRPELQEDDANTPLKKLKTTDDPSEISPVQIKYQQDDSKKTRFGASEVLLTYADLEALQRKTGPASLTFLGAVKSSKITPAMMVSSDIYLIVSDNSKKSQAQFSALVTALLKQNKYGLARRIGTTNGKVNVGILYPVSDELGKALYFLKVPFADWVKSVPLRPLPDVSEEPLANLMSQLIDNMSIDGRGRDLLIRDPNFQLRCAQVEQRVIEGESGAPLPSHIVGLFDPYPELLEAGEPILKRILRNYPIPPPPPAPETTTTTTTTTAPMPVACPAVKKELSEEEKKEIQAIEELVGEDVEGFLDEGGETMC